MKSWETTAAGAGAIITAIGVGISELSSGGLEAVSWGIMIPAILAGVGLILGRSQRQHERDNQPGDTDG